MLKVLKKLFEHRMCFTVNYFITLSLITSTSETVSSVVQGNMRANQTLETEFVTLFFVVFWVIVKIKTQ